MELVWVGEQSDFEVEQGISFFVEGVKAVEKHRREYF